MRRTALIAALVLAASAAAAKPMPRYGVFVYSNQCISEQSSDLYGYRITLWRFGDEDRLQYEFSDGAEHALAARSLTVDTKTGAVGFMLDAPGGSETAFSGRLSADGAWLTIRGELYSEPDRQYRLARVIDFSKPVPVCK